jgi:dTDP-4-dehydrorhamnose reductase
MKPVVLLIGKTGQVGAELLQFLPQLGEVVAPDRSQMELSVPNDIRRTIRDVRPRLIVNAAAYTAVDQAERDETKARIINAEAPGVIAEEAKAIGAAMVHYSTDYIFDGLKRTPYEESDHPNPINIYGKTKLEGEEAIRSAGISHLIFRTAWVYATRGRNFLLTILRLATEREELKIVSDQIGAPTWSRDIAVATSEILSQILAKNNAGSGFSKYCGIYHLTAAGETTWFDFAKAILEEASRIAQHIPWFAAATGGRPLITTRVIPITTKEYPTPASRPAYSVLSNSLLTRTFGFKMQDWRRQLSLSFATEREGAHRALRGLNHEV